MYPPYPPYPNPRLWAAAQKNYTTNAVWSLLLYFLFWLPGLLVNCYYLYDAYQTKKVTGHSPQGLGCLWTTLILFNFPFLLLLLFLLYALVVASVNIGNPSTANSFDQTSAQQAVYDANTQLGNDISSLKSYTSQLANDTNFHDVLSSYAKDWRQDQKDFAQEQSDYQGGCSNYGTVRGDNNIVLGDHVTIQGDDVSLLGAERPINGDISWVQSLTQQVQSDWQALQAALAGLPGSSSSFSSGDVTSVLQAATHQVADSQKAVKDADNQAAGYDTEAESLVVRADALPDTMHC